MEYPQQPLECGECAAFTDGDPHLPGAAASVGITYGKSTAQVLLEYLRAYHARGHQEAAP